MSNDKTLHEQVIDPKVKTITYYDSSIPVSCYYFHSPLIRYDNSYSLYGTNAVIIGEINITLGNFSVLTLKKQDMKMFLTGMNGYKAGMLLHVYNYCIMYITYM